MWIKPGSEASVMELVPKFTVLYKMATGNDAQFFFRSMGDLN